VQDEVNQDYSEQNEVDGMKKGADYSCMDIFIAVAIWQQWVSKG